MPEMRFKRQHDRRHASDMTSMSMWTRASTRYDAVEIKKSEARLRKINRQSNTPGLSMLLILLFGGFLTSDEL